MQTNRASKSPLLIILVTIITLVLSYYVGILLHEWSHGTMAWILGQKSSPFDIDYGHGWYMRGIDENVDYDNLLARGNGMIAALIAISGVTLDIMFVILFFTLLKYRAIQRNPLLVSFSYWSLLMSMVPVIQYFSISTFSREGDTGRFIHGLNISPWWIFAPGTILVVVALWRIFTVEIPKAYACIPVKNSWLQKFFLISSFFILFLFIYTLGYNPLSDKGSTTLTKFLAILSILLVPLIFFICNPSRNWVRRAVLFYREN